MERVFSTIGLIGLALIAGCAGQENQPSSPASPARLVAISDGTFGDLSCTQNLQFATEPTPSEAQKAFSGCVVNESDARRGSLRGLHARFTWYTYPPYYYDQQYYSNPLYNNYNYGCVLFFGKQAKDWNFNCISYIGGYGNSYVGNNYNNYCTSNCVYSLDPYCYQRCGSYVTY